MRVGVRPGGDAMVMEIISGFGVSDWILLRLVSFVIGALIGRR